MELSIVTTLYYSAPHLNEFYQRIVAEVEKVTKDFEIILVNDGSPDNSLEIAIGLFEKDPRVKIIDLSRNFGHHNAMLTGLAETKGEKVFLIDCDLEEEPELFGQFYEKMKLSQAEVVLGIQKKRKGDFFERISGGVFWKLISVLSHYPIPRNQLVCRLMTRQYISALLEHQETEIFFPGICAITGFKQIPLPVHKYSKSSSTYTFKKKLSQALNAVTSFSALPLVFVFYMGTFITLLAGSYATWLVARRILFKIYLQGWLSTVVSIWLLSGIIIFCIGVTGIYLSKVFMEVKQRPKTIIRKRYEHQEGELR